MARLIQVLLLCDPCMREDQRVEGEDFTLSIAGIAQSKPRTLTLCEVHRKEFYDPIHDLLAELGQAVDAQPKTVKAPKAAKKSAAVATSVKVSDTEPGEFACPAEGCGSVLKNMQTLKTHCRAQHGRSLAELEGQDLPFKCDECERAFGLPQHLARHRHTAHGIAPGGSLKSA